MSQEGASALAPASASKAEKHARPPAGTSLANPRSCAICRSRKVRCDKQSPCSNCRRANIACVRPSIDQAPRWARRMQRGPSGDVMDRLRTLEHLVKDLSSRLEQANAAISAAGGSSGVNSPGSLTHGTETGSQDASSSADRRMQTQFGRLVVGDATRSRYVGSGFWSRVNDELDELKMDTQDPAYEEYDTTDDGFSYERIPSTQELERSPMERHSFLFRHNLSSPTPDLREFHPLPSQIPFLLDVFSENVNSVTQTIHLPTVTQMVRDLRGDMTRLTPANEALMFSIYYATITSMEDDDIAMNFGSTKQELNLKYRLGLELALAKADFLNVPDLVLIQAFVNFLVLLRRHDSPRFVWMMTGLAIRMGIALGLHRDGSKFPNLSLYDIEMRRRVWWGICMLDQRASEDQGTEFTIQEGSFDTKMPLNINNADIGPNMKEMPIEREGLTDMSLPRLHVRTIMIGRQLMAQSARGASIEEQNQLLQEIYLSTEEFYLQHSAESKIAHWVILTITRLVMAKMTLLIHLPLLFTSPSEQLTADLRTRLLVSAIEVAEYNHALNAEQACRHWRWIYQTYTHWHAIVYILIEICRQSWSLERAWVALHSVWLIPNQSHMDKNARFCFPLQKLMANARKHRQSELIRLRSDSEAVSDLEREHTKMPIPSSPELASNGLTSTLERWRQLLVTNVNDGGSAAVSDAQLSVQGYPGSSSALASVPLYPTADSESLNPVFKGPGLAATNPDESACIQTVEQPSDVLPVVPAYRSDGQPVGPTVIPWIWASDASPNMNLDPNDINMDFDADVDWYEWVASAKNMELYGNQEGFQ
ncbi:hypothetical protein N7532_001562 [Penicillium argentinense]|uniref:Zn(2)-C6 fungal-type domain-containing protein n=1 Tax=Penicillium argentinense TaxID=1131581 RepID=A0A9W9G2U7_9EURO|nr:uncharacterized protein N7532_001562 [Penicillium argentinense]KAJ5111027.1 hypothetical protein N7532_001562 [Penicillium argentinense]